MFKTAFLALFLLVTGVIQAQYLEYSEMMEVLDKARDTSAVSRYLTEKRFILNSAEAGELGYNLLFEAIGTDDDYFVGLYEDRENGIYTVIEYTKNPGRWDAYIRAAKRNDFALSGMKDHGDGVNSFTYMKGEMLMSLWIFKKEDGARYQFSFSKEIVE